MLSGGDDALSSVLYLLRVWEGYTYAGTVSELVLFTYSQWRKKLPNVTLRERDGGNGNRNEKSKRVLMRVILRACSHNLALTRNSG